MLPSLLMFIAMKNLVNLHCSHDINDSHSALSSDLKLTSEAPGTLARKSPVVTMRDRLIYCAFPSALNAYPPCPAHPQRRHQQDIGC